MKAFRPTPLRVIAASLGLACTALSAGAADNAPDVSAADLAARLSAIRQSGLSSVRMRMEIRSGVNGPRTNLQLLIKERRTKNASDVVYQVLWPKERKGEAVLLHKSGSGRASGTLFVPPNKVKAIEAGSMDDALFGSDLAYEDVVDNFFGWDQQTIVGSEVVDGVTCQILESKPGKSGGSIYGSVRSWIDTRRMVPLRVEKLSASGQTVRRIDTLRVVIDDGHSIPANLTVKGPRQGAGTVLDGSKIRHDVNFSDRDFSVDGLKESASGAPPPE